MVVNDNMSPIGMVTRKDLDVPAMVGVATQAQGALRRLADGRRAGRRHGRNRAAAQGL